MSRYHCRATLWLKWKRLTTISDDGIVIQLEISYVDDRNVKWNSHFGKKPLFYKDKHTSYDLAIPPLGI